MINRPPIGFIVEGHGEYNCYPSLFCKISNGTGFKVPVVNAGGCGGILKHLGEQLSNLLLADSPESVIVTVDLKDAVHQGFAEDHDDLIQKLRQAIDKWKESAVVDPRLQPLPARICCVVQVQKFESWLIADVEGLKAAEIVRSDVAQMEDAEAIKEPTIWLKQALRCDGNLKSPQFAKKVVAALSPDVMKNHSDSFLLFHGECKASYAVWERRLIAAAEAV
jgi:predicted RNase H-like HicB family nuclease